MNIPSLAITFVSSIMQLMMIVFYLFIPGKKIRWTALVIGSIFVVLVFPSAMALMTKWQDTFNNLFWIGLFIAVVTWVLELFVIPRNEPFLLTAR